MTSLVQISPDNFSEVVNGSSVVIILITAEWVDHNRAYPDAFEKVADTYPGVTFGYLDAEKEEEFVKELNITVVPTTVGFRDGIIVYHESGEMVAEQVGTLADEMVKIDVEVLKAEIRKIEEREAEEERRTRPPEALPAADSEDR